MQSSCAMIQDSVVSFFLMKWPRAVELNVFAAWLSAAVKYLAFPRVKLFTFQCVG